jgi:cytochrome c oxidase subunit 1
MKTKRLLSVFIVLLAIHFLPDLLIWTHQTLVFRRHPFAFPVFLFIIVLILIPLIIKWYRWLISHWFAESNSESVVLFTIGGFCWILTYWKLRDSILDFQVHDTYFIMSSVAVCLYISLGFGILSIVYFVFPLITGRNLDLNLSRFHFWGTYISLNVIVGTWSTDLALGPRRYFEYAGWDSYDQIQLLNKFNFTILILFMIAQLLFLFNLVFSLFRKSKV